MRARVTICCNGVVEQLTAINRKRAFGAFAVLVIAPVLLLLVFRPGEEAAAAVTLDDPSVWVEHGLDGQLLRINGRTGEVTTRVDVATPGVDFVAHPHGDGAVVVDASTDLVSFVSGSNLAVSSTVPVPLADSTIVSDVSVFGRSDDLADVLIVEEEQAVAVSVEDAEGTSTVLESPLSSTAQTASGEIFGLSIDQDSVVRIGSEGVAAIAVLDDPVDEGVDQRQIVSAGGRIFALDPARLSMAEVLPDGSMGNPICMRSAANGAVHGGSGEQDEAIVASLNAATGVLAISSADGTCRDVDVDIDNGVYGPPVVSNGVAYLPFWEEGRVIAVLLEDGRTLSDTAFGTPGRAFELDVYTSTVWANERLGPFAAIFDGAEVLPVAKVSAIRITSDPSQEGGGGSSLAIGDINQPGVRVLGDEGDAVFAADVDIVSDEPSLPGNGNAEPDEFEFPPTDVPTDATPFGLDLEGVSIETEVLESELEEVLGANFSVSSTEVTVGEVVRFSDTSLGTPVTWSWTFGDGTAAATPDTQKAWTEEGLYVVTLTVTNVAGATSVQSVEVRVVPEDILLPPNADFQFSRNTIEEGQAVNFSSTTTGEVDSLAWDFGDGTTGAGVDVSHQFNAAGSYNVVLTATNAAGSTTSSVTVTVLAGVEPPVAAIEPFPRTVFVGQFVNFASASLNEPTQTTWRFGDGTNANGATARHSWNEPGTYRVTLEVENSEGTDTTFADITVERRVAEPVSQFTQSGTEVLVGEPVRFTNTSLNEPDQLTWNFDDGTNSNQPNPTHQWSEPGQYRVTLRAENEAGTSQSGVTVTVIRPVDPPTASFNTNGTRVATGQDVIFTDTSANDPTSWQWTFESAGEASVQNPYRSWSRAGTYTVRLRVSNEGGSSSAETVITVIDPPTAAFRVEQQDDDTFRFINQSSNADTYQWDFGDGSSSSQQSPTHTFDSGRFQVTLRTSNDVASAGPARAEVVVADPPVARIDCDANGNVLTCSGEESDNASEFEWSAEDSVSNSDPNGSTTTFTFDSDGRKQVTLRVTSREGMTDTETIRSPQVSSLQEPRVLSVSVVSIEGDVVRLSAEFDREPTDWLWEIDDVDLVDGANSPNPTFNVPGPGTYSGFVTAANAAGDDRDPVRFTVEEPEEPAPDASFDWEVIEPGVVRFTNTASGYAGETVTWRFTGSVEVLESSDDGAVVRYPDEGGSFRSVLVIRSDRGNTNAVNFVEVPPVDNGPEDDEPEQDDG